MLIPEETYENMTQRLYTLASKDCNIDTITNLKQMYYHEVIAYQNAFEKYLEEREKEMKRVAKESKIRFKKPSR